MKVGLSLLHLFSTTAARNAAWQLMDRGGRAIATVLVGLLVARHLGPAEFGLLSLSLSITGIVGSLATLGLEDVLLRDGVRHGSNSAVWRRAVGLRIRSAVAAYVTLLSVTWAWQPDSPRLWVITAIVGAGLLFAPADLVETWFHARSDARPPALGRQLALWLAAGWRLGLVAMDAGLIAFAVASLAEACLVASALALIRWRTPVIESGLMLAATATPRVPSSREMVQEGLPLLASGFLVTLTMQIDRVMLTQFGAAADVGRYVLAVRFSELFHVIPVAVGAAALPGLIRLRAVSPERYWKRARGLLLMAVAGGMFSAAGLSFGVPLIVGRFFGPEFGAAEEIVQIHCWTLVFVFIISLRSRLLVLEGGSRWILWMMVLTATTNVLANFLLVPQFGAKGAAWAAVIAWGASATAFPWFFRNVRALLVSIFSANRETRA